MQTASAKVLGTLRKNDLGSRVGYDAFKGLRRRHHDPGHGHGLEHLVLHTTCDFQWRDHATRMSEIGPDVRHLSNHADPGTFKGADGRRWMAPTTQNSAVGACRRIAGNISLENHVTASMFGR